MAEAPTKPAIKAEPPAAAKSFAAMSGVEKVRALDEMRERLQSGGGKAAIEKRHQAGKLTARERLEVLLDDGSFQEMYLFRQHRNTDFGMAGK